MIVRDRWKTFETFRDAAKMRRAANDSSVSSISPLLENDSLKQIANKKPGWMQLLNEAENCLRRIEDKGEFLFIFF